MVYVRSIISRLRFLKDTLSDFQLGIFLCLCLILGGTSQYILQPKTALYTMSIVIIAVNLMRVHSHANWKPFLFPILGFGLIILTCFLQLIPLPPDLWITLQGRESVAHGFEALNMEKPWLPISLTPEITRFSLLDFLPPLAVIAIFINGINQVVLQNTIKLLLSITAISILLGLLQISTSLEMLYFYKITNDQSLVGFFSNRNHLTTLLLVTFPFAITYLFNRHDVQRKNLLFGLPLAVIFGVILVGSLFGYILLAPVVLGSIILCTTQRHLNFLPLYIFLAIGFIIFAIDILFLNNYLLNLTKTFETLTFGQRLEFTYLTYDVAMDYFPIGSGLGSFENIYKQYSDVGTRFVNHAHNDVIETLVEFGIFGAIYMAGFILYFIKMTLTVARSNLKVSSFAWPAIFGIAIITLHSLVDLSLIHISEPTRPY